MTQGYDRDKTKSLERKLEEQARGDIRFVGWPIFQSVELKAKPISAADKAAQLIFDYVDGKPFIEPEPVRYIVQVAIDTETKPLHALIEKLKEVMPQWIRVEEKLPEYGSCVQVYGYDDDGEKIPYQDIATFSYHNGWCVGSDRSNEYVVTHWQPLLAPPIQ